MTSETETRSRNLVWGVTWLAYASYYLGRKGFSAAKGPLEAARVLDLQALGAIDSLYLAAYSLGQFGSGVLGDRVGARRLVGYGLLTSAALCAAFGSASSALLMTVLFTLNGAAQATGWPGTMRAMAEWTTSRNRGTVMGWWSTCYQVGPFVAGPFAGVLIARFGWRAGFHVPALGMALVAFLVLWLVKPAPLAAGEEITLSASEGASDPRRLAQRAVLRNTVLWSYGASYFFIKFVRYALQLWLPYYLFKQLHYGAGKASVVASAFEGGGMLGVIAIGHLSDRGSLRRVPLAAGALLGLSFALFAGAMFVGDDTALNVVLFALIGAFLFAPDSILSGAAAQDAGGRHAASLATGFVNGLGSLGALLVGLTVPSLAQSWGWHALFPGLVVMAVLAALCLWPVLRARAAPAAGSNLV